jgi:hypothetical protein
VDTLINISFGAFSEIVSFSVVEKLKGRVNDFYQNYGMRSCCTHVCRWKHFCCYGNKNVRANIVFVERRGNLGCRGNGYGRDVVLWTVCT